MIKFALALALCLSSVPAFASCKSEATDKKLAGAALNSFMTKCEKDAGRGVRNGFGGEETQPAPPRPVT